MTLCPVCQVAPPLPADLGVVELRACAACVRPQRPRGCVVKRGWVVATSEAVGEIEMGGGA